MHKRRKPIGVYPISNVLSILVLDIDYYDDKVLAIANNENSHPIWCDITEEEEDGLVETGFKFGEMFIPFSATMRI